jgi:hypothetical protein
MEINFDRAGFGEREKNRLFRVAMSAWRDNVVKITASAFNFPAPAPKADGRGVNVWYQSRDRLSKNSNRLLKKRDVSPKNSDRLS